MGYFNIYGQYVNGNDELYHHGIMGMKWGERNGPPYPLGASDHSAAEKKLKSSNAGELESWKKKKVATIEKKYGKKVSRIDKKASRTTDKRVLEKLKSKKAKALFKQSVKTAKVEGTTEKQYKARQRIKKALKIVGGLAVAVAAAYLLNKAGMRRAASRMIKAREDYSKINDYTRALTRAAVSVKASDSWREGIIKTLNSHSDELIFARSGLDKATSMYDIYTNASILEKLITQIKGF